MKKHTNPLDHVSVAAPCPSDWERMVGNDRVRFCSECSLNVYNLSGMTRAEAERLIGSSEGRLCIRFYRRADGTIITKNCPVGLRALKQRMTRMATALASLLLSFLAGVLAFAGFQKPTSTPDYGSGYTQGAIAVTSTTGQNVTTNELGEMAGPPSVTTGTMAFDPALLKKTARVRRRNR